MLRVDVGAVVTLYYLEIDARLEDHGNSSSIWSD
jgi:hypothetical protein